MPKLAMLPLAATLMAALCLPQAAWGHGLLQQPAARNVLSQQAGLQYDPQSLSAGGTGVVGAGGAVWPAGQHGVCGDPAPSDRPHEAGGRFYFGNVTGEFTEGQVANLTVRLTANHMGRMSFRICRVAGADVASERAQLGEACLDQNVLLQADAPGAQAPGQRWWYVPSGQFLFQMPYKLPQGLTCDGTTSKCVLQWYWLTGNSCDPPGIPTHYSNPQLGTCGANSPYPEEFWNCADIRIMPSGSASSPPSPPPSSSSPPPPPPPPRPSPSPSPSPSPASPRPPPPRPSPSPSPAPPRSSPPPPPAPHQSPPPPPTTTSPQPPPPQQSAAPSPPPASTPTPASTFCAGKALGWYADPVSRCQSYYRCEANGSWLLQCPSGLMFNQDARACDWPANVSCPSARKMHRRLRL